MAYVLPENVHETTTSTGTTPLTLAGAVADRFAFSSQMSNGDTTTVTVTDGVDLQVCEATFTSPDQLALGAVTFSTNGGALVSWTAGTRNVYVGLSGEQMASLLDPSMAVGLVEKTGDRTYSSTPVATFIKTLLDDTSASAAANTLLLNKKGADIASAATFPIGADGDYFDVTGTTGITAISGGYVGQVVRLHFDGVVTLTHHATDLILPGGVNLITAAGDELTFVQYASGDFRCVGVVRAAVQSYAFPVVGALFLRSGAQAITTSGVGGFQGIVFNSSVYEYIECLSNPGGGTIITVPSGVTLMSVVAQLSYEPNADNMRMVRLYDVTASGYTTPTCEQGVSAASTTQQTVLSLVSAWMPVTPGNTYRIDAWQNSGVTLNLESNETWLSVEFK